MVNLSVCFETFWEGLAPEEKIRRAAALGFKRVEFWQWSDKDVSALKKASKESGVEIGTFCFEPMARLVDPSAGPELLAGLEKSVKTAKSLGVDRLIITAGNERKAESFECTRRTVVRNLKALVPALEKAKITLCLEPLNPLVDHLGYWLTKMSEAADICREVGSPHVKILMDIYHQQVTEGNIIANIRQYAPLIGHYHVAGCPDRHELAGSDLDYRSVFKAIGKTGYEGLVGIELFPLGDSDAALRQAQELAK